MLKNFFKNAKTKSEWVDFIERMLGYILLAFGTTISGVWAYTSQALREMGPFMWVIVTVCIGLSLSIIFFLINLGFKIKAQANLTTVQANHVAILSTPKSNINPLAEVFSDQVIYIPDLYLPILSVHKNKVFKRCKIVGPGAVAIMGGTIMNNNFHGCGDFIGLPENTMLTGILVLENCTIENCDIVQVTITSSLSAIAQLKSESKVASI